MNKCVLLMTENYSYLDGRASCIVFKITRTEFEPCTLEVFSIIKRKV